MLDHHIIHFPSGELMLKTPPFEKLQNKLFKLSKKSHLPKVIKLKKAEKMSTTSENRFEYERLIPALNGHDISRIR